MSRDRITITIPSWDKYNPRKDLKTNPWFRFDREFINSAEIFDMTPTNKWIMVAIMAMCCRKGGTVQGTITWMSNQAGVPVTQFKAALELIEKNGFITTRTGHEQGTNRTNPEHELYVTERNVTERNVTNVTRLSCQSQIDWVGLWNSNCGTLPKIKTLSKKRASQVKARFKENPDPEYWISVFKKISQSSFAASGNWASFDWVTKNDTNHTKVIEGNYDNRIPPQKKFTPQPYMKNPLED